MGYNPLMGVTVSRIEQPEFDALRAEWNTLLERSRADNVFLRWEWIHTWSRLLRGDHPLYLLVARENETLLGVLPLYLKQSTPLGLRWLCFCADDLVPDYLDVIAAPGREPEVMASIVDYLRSHAAEWDVLLFDSILADSILLDHRAAFDAFSHRTEPGLTCPYLRITGRLADYYAARYELERLSLDKKSKKFFALEQSRHHITRTEAELQKSLNDLFFLHESRSKARNRTSSFTRPDVRKFHQELSGLLLKEGFLDLQLLYQGTTPAAATYGFRYKNKIYYYQTGINASYLKWSVGSLLFRLGIAQAFQSQYDEVDFLKGDEAYKTLWTNATREEFQLLVFNHHWRACLFGRWKAVESGLRTIKGTLQNIGKLALAF